uniref:Uncharacterized protein n=1 Tax=Physcomitrium patens TaxID=3218 RepID=A0A2K1IGY9_PHYPA|nr:hypothetical protein PHYPA_029133 [Physcomitrium patens]
MEAIRLEVNSLQDLSSNVVTTLNLDSVLKGFVNLAKTFR